MRISNFIGLVAVLFLESSAYATRPFYGTYVSDYKVNKNDAANPMAYTAAQIGLACDASLRAWTWNAGSELVPHYAGTSTATACGSGTNLIVFFDTCSTGAKCGLGAVTSTHQVCPDGYLLISIYRRGRLANPTLVLTADSTTETEIPGLVSNHWGQYVTGATASDPSCLTSLNPSNTTLIQSRNGTCLSETNLLRQVTAAPHHTWHEKVRAASTTVLAHPTSGNWSNVATDLDFVVGPGGMDTQTGVFAIPVLATNITSLNNGVTPKNATWVEQPSASAGFEGETTLPLTNSRPTIVFDPTRSVWWAFERSFTASDQVVFATSTDLHNWTNLGTLTAYDLYFPSNPASNVTTRMPVGAAFSTATDSVIVFYVSSVGEIPSIGFNGIIAAGALALVSIPADGSFNGPIRRTTRWEMIGDATVALESISYTTPRVTCTEQFVTQAFGSTTIRSDQCFVFYSEMLETDRRLNGLNLSVYTEYPTGGTPSFDNIGITTGSLIGSNMNFLPAMVTHYPVGAATHRNGTSPSSFVTAVAATKESPLFETSVATRDGASSFFTAWETQYNPDPNYVQNIFSYCGPNVIFDPWTSAWTMYSCGSAYDPLGMIRNY
jgi:hypothetical protein